MFYSYYAMEKLVHDYQVERVHDAAKYHRWHEARKAASKLVASRKSKI